MNKFEKMYKGSYYTITGCGGNLEEWKDGYNKMLNGHGIGAPTEWIHFTGKEMNEEYSLKGDNAYPDDLNFLAFSLEGLDIGKLAIFKLEAMDRWFDDIVDNNRSKQEGM